MSSCRGAGNVQSLCRCGIAALASDSCGRARSAAASASADWDRRSTITSRHAEPAPRTSPRSATAADRPSAARPPVNSSPRRRKTSPGPISSPPRCSLPPAAAIGDGGARVPPNRCPRRPRARRRRKSADSELVAYQPRSSRR